VAELETGGSGSGETAIGAMVQSDSNGLLGFPREYCGNKAPFLNARSSMDFKVMISLKDHQCLFCCVDNEYETLRCDLG
jgi:hypothetical protein